MFVDVDLSEVAACGQLGGIKGELECRSTCSTIPLVTVLWKTACDTACDVHVCCLEIMYAVWITCVQTEPCIQAVQIGTSLTFELHTLQWGYEAWVGSCTWTRVMPQQVQSLQLWAVNLDVWRPVWKWVMICPQTAELWPSLRVEGTELPASQNLDSVTVCTERNFESLLFLVVIRCVKRWCRVQTCPQSLPFFLSCHPGHSQQFCTAPSSTGGWW